MVRPVTAGRTEQGPVLGRRGPLPARRSAVAAHAASLAVGFAVLLYFNRNQWFTGDEWAFLGHRGVFHAARSLWQPHNEHWSTAPILVYRALYAMFGVRTYLPYVVVLLGLHLAVAHLLWRLMRGAGVGPPVATGLTAVFVVLGAGYENLLWAFQIGFVGSVALGLLAVVLVNHADGFGRRDIAGWAAGTAALMFSGIGVTMVAVVALTTLLRRGVRDAALTAAVPGLVYTVWVTLVGREGLGAPRAVAGALDYADYVWTGLRSAVEQTTGLPGTGPFVVLGLAAWLLWRGGRASGPSAPAFAGAVGAVLLFSMIAVGRTAFGVEQSEASRYTYIAVALALPAVGLVLHELAGRVALRQGFVGFLLLLALLHNLGLLREQSARQAGPENRLKTTVLAASQLTASPAAILDPRPDPVYNPDLSIYDIFRMQRDGKLPSSEGITPADRVAAATVFQYAVGPAGLPQPVTPARVESLTGASQQPAGPGCLRLAPTGGVVEIHLAGGDPISVTLTSSAGGEVTGYLRVDTPEELTGPPRTDTVTAGAPVHVKVTASVDHVILRIPSTGPSELCAIR